MPIYEYRCEKCQHVMELLETFGASSKEHRCEKCGSKAVHRLLSAPNIRMGGGSTSSASSCPTGTCPIT